MDLTRQDIFEYLAGKDPDCNPILVPLLAKIRELELEVARLEGIISVYEQHFLPRTRGTSRDG